MERVGRFFVALSITVVASSCTTERDRPGQDPVALGEDILNQTLLVISSPRDGQTLLRSTFTNAPGVRVAFGGVFRPDHTVVVVAFTGAFQSPPISFAEITVDPTNVPTESWILATPEQVENAELIRIFLHVVDSEARVVSTDSVFIPIE